MEGGQASVLDGQAVGLRDELGERKLTEDGQGAPFDGIGLGELVEGQGGESGQVEQVELATDGLDAAAGEADQVPGAVSDNIASDLLRSTEIDDTRGIRADDNGSANAGALGQRASISRIGDGSGRLRAEGWLGSWRHKFVSTQRRSVG